MTVSSTARSLTRPDVPRRVAFLAVSFGRRDGNHSDLAVGETVILMTPPLSIHNACQRQRGAQQNGGLADGYSDLALLHPKAAKVPA